MLDQDKVITVKTPYYSEHVPDIPPANSFFYAIQLSTAIQIQVASFDHLDYAKFFFNLMKLTSLKVDRMPMIDVFIKYTFKDLYKNHRYLTEVVVVPDFLFKEHYPKLL